MKRLIWLILFLSCLQICNAQCWRDIAAGAGYTIAINMEGTLSAWGMNDRGTFGNGNYTGSYVPVQVSNENDWESISAGVDHVLGIKTDHSLWAWGSNQYGQLGDSLFTQSNVPIRIGNENNWKFINAGGFHSHAIKEDGSLWAWGDNFYYQLGDGTRTTLKTPTRIGTDNNWRTISSIYIFSVGLKSDGTIWCWGNNNYGQLGLGDPSLPYIFTPMQMQPDTNWSSVVAGYAFCLALKKDSSLWAWGDNWNGQIGIDGSVFTGNVIAPREISTDKWKSIAVGYTSSYAIKKEGSLWGWGNNANCQLGIGPVIPLVNDKVFSLTRIDSSDNWKRVVAKFSDPHALKADSTLFGWGANDYGQVGNGITSSLVERPVNINCPFPLPVKMLSFTAHPISSGGTLLKWQTETENNSKSYNLEISLDGVAFMPLVTIGSNNAANGSHYSYRDAVKRSGYFYYRIKCVDFNGEFYFSQIIKASSFYQQATPLIYPNPFNHFLYVADMPADKMKTIRLADITGRIIFNKQTRTSSYTISTDNIPAGIYFLIVSDGDKTENIKVIKE